MHLLGAWGCGDGDLPRHHPAPLTEQKLRSDQSPRQPHQALLHRRGDQPPVPGREPPRRQPPRSGRRRRVARSTAATRRPGTAGGTTSRDPGWPSARWPWTDHAGRSPSRAASCRWRRSAGTRASSGSSGSRPSARIHTRTGASARPPVGRPHRLLHEPDVDRAGDAGPTSRTPRPLATRSPRSGSDSGSRHVGGAGSVCSSALLVAAGTTRTARRSPRRAGWPAPAGW